jgi:hypothetical protein
MDYKQWKSSINDILGSLDNWRMISEDLETKGGILLQHWKIRRYLGTIAVERRRCGRNIVTELRRLWETQRKRRDGGAMI